MAVGSETDPSPAAHTIRPSPPALPAGVWRKEGREYPAAEEHQSHRPYSPPVPPDPWGSCATAQTRCRRSFCSAISRACRIRGLAGTPFCSSHQRTSRRQNCTSSTRRASSSSLLGAAIATTRPAACLSDSLRSPTVTDLGRTRQSLGRGRQPSMRRSTHRPILTRRNPLPTLEGPAEGAGLGEAQ